MRDEATINHRPVEAHLILLDKTVIAVLEHAIIVRAHAVTKLKAECEEGSMLGAEYWRELNTLRKLRDAVSGLYDSSESTPTAKVTS